MSTSNCISVTKYQQSSITHRLFLEISSYFGCIVPLSSQSLLRQQDLVLSILFRFVGDDADAGTVVQLSVLHVRSVSGKFAILQFSVGLDGSSYQYSTYCFVNFWLLVLYTWHRRSTQQILFLFFAFYFARYRQGAAAAGELKDLCSTQRELHANDERRLSLSTFQKDDSLQRERYPMSICKSSKSET